jgi:hypothetical protein
MKTQNKTLRIFSLATAFVVLLAALPSAHATIATWGSGNSAPTGNWSNTADWGNGTVPNGPSDAALYTGTNPASTSFTTTVNGSYTVADIIASYSTNTYTWTIATDGVAGDGLTLGSSGTLATVYANGSGVGNVSIAITAPITLGGNAQFAGTKAGQSLNIDLTGTVGGSGNITAAGNGTGNVSFGTVNNVGTFTAGVTTAETVGGVSVTAVTNAGSSTTGGVQVAAFGPNVTAFNINNGNFTPSASNIFAKSVNLPVTIASGAVLNLNGQNLTIYDGNALTNNGTITDGIGIANPGIATLTFNSNNGYTVGGLVGGGTAANPGTGGHLSIAKTGVGAVTVTGSNNYGSNTASGASNEVTNVYGGSLIGTSPIVPFGSASIDINGGTLGLEPSGSGAAVTYSLASKAVAVGASQLNANLTYGPGSTLALNKGSNASLAVTVGMVGGTNTAIFQRSGGGGTLIIAPAGGTGGVGGGTGDLGNTSSGEALLVFSGSGTQYLPTVASGIVSPSIVGQNNDSNQSADFLTYSSANGFYLATYSSNTDITAGNNTTVFQSNGSSTNLTLTSGNAAVYALQDNGQTINLNGNALTTGTGGGQAGIILNGGTISSGTLAFGGAEGVVYTSLANGAISSQITGSNGVTYFGPGVITLSNAATVGNYTGSTYVNNTTVNANNSANFSTGTIFLMGGTIQASSGASFNLPNQFELTPGQASNAGIFDIGSGATVTLSGKFINNTVTGGGQAGSLTKISPGTLILSYGGSTYTGATAVNGGTLVVSGSISGTTSVSGLAGTVLSVDGLVNHAATVTSAGQVQGQGSVGALSVSGTLAPGVSTANSNNGTLTAFGNVSLTGAAAFSIRLGQTIATGEDQLALSTTNTITLNSATLRLTPGANYATQANGTIYEIINGDSSTLAAGTAIIGQFSNGSSITASNGDLFNILYGVNATDTGAGNDVDLQLVTVPEPGTWEMLLGGMGVLGIWQRSRRLRN